ncbi:MAG: nitroreductase [Candidatus Thalassarchaeaceae archaeon]|nr:nitroreductase [Candidatus Thalassarchaeaceae archaeon]
MSVFQDVLTSRRTIYKFSEKKVREEALELAFDAARNAPCHKNTHPWKFYVMGDAVRKEIIPEVKRLAKKKVPDGEDSGAGISKAVDKILSPPVLICVTSALSPQDPFREGEDYAATVCATHNLVLSLWGNGIGSQWSTGAITRSKALYGAIGVSPNEERIIGFIKIGYPSGGVPTKNKKGLEEIREYIP